MGGYGSGRQHGRPVAEHCRRVELDWMMQTGRALPGYETTGSIHYTCGGEPSGSIGYRCDMRDLENAKLTLNYTRTPLGGEPEKVEQHIWLTYTQPHYGGRRWWMTCPYGGGRVGKLYLPPTGDRFASRKAWRLGYQSQRNTEHDRPFEALAKLQKRLGCEEGWERPIRRPKGMWNQTYAEYERRYWELDAQCSAAMMDKLGALRGMRF